MSKPFIKWAGGKRQLLKYIREKYNADVLEDRNKYCEPFLGGGAVFFDIIKNKKFDEILLNDATKELIITYEMIKQSVEEIIKNLKNIEEEYIKLNDDLRKEYFYNKRKEYNSIIKNSTEKDNLDIATLFIFLNKTCFNGLYRVNKKGEFNVPIGSYKKPLICDAENLRKVNKDLQNVKFINKDFQETLDFIDDKTIVYIDPPYRPISKTSNFNSYHHKEFDDLEQKRLAEFCDIVAKKGAKLIISNSNPKNTNPDDDFFEILYKKFNIEIIEANRFINSKAEGRKAITELLITNIK